MIEWLAAHPGQTWQERWQATGADALGNAGWWRPSLDRLQAGSIYPEDVVSYHRAFIARRRAERPS